MPRRQQSPEMIARDRRIVRAYLADDEPTIEELRERMGLTTGIISRALREAKVKVRRHNKKNIRPEVYAVAGDYPLHLATPIGKKFCEQCQVLKKLDEISRCTSRFCTAKPSPRGEAANPRS